MDSMVKYYPKSRVETKGFMARHYDSILDIASLGRYPSFIEKAIQLMEIKPLDRILDLGAGGGRNACLMAKYLSSQAELIGMDISLEVISRFKKRCANFSNAKIIQARIDQSLPWEEKFDKIFISFVLHGFPQEVRETIIENAFKALNNSGALFILDYNEFSYKNMPFYFKAPFKFVECPYAFDFIGRDWKHILAKQDFGRFEEFFFFHNYVRLLKAQKNILLRKS